MSLLYVKGFIFPQEIILLTCFGFSRISKLVSFPNKDGFA